MNNPHNTEDTDRSAPKLVSIREIIIALVGMVGIPMTIGLYGMYHWGWADRIAVPLMVGGMIGGLIAWLVIRSYLVRHGKLNPALIGTPYRPNDSRR